MSTNEAAPNSSCEVPKEGQYQSKAQTGQTSRMATGDWTVVDWFLDAVKSVGVETVFGITGANVGPLFCTLEKRPDDFNLIVTRIEGGASFMGTTFAMAKGRPAMVAATAGPVLLHLMALGALNLLNGVQMANTHKLPLLVVTGNPPASRVGKGTAQELIEEFSHVEVFRPITKLSVAITSPENCCTTLQRALAVMFSGSPGPVHINVSVNLWKMKISVPIPEPALQSLRLLKPGVNAAAIRTAAQAFRKAKNPLVLVGNGTRMSGAREDVIQIVEQLKAKAVSTITAKGVFPEDHKDYLGILGISGHASAKTAFDKCDLLLVLGSSMGDCSLGLAPDVCNEHRDLIRVDLDETRLARLYVPTFPILGDVREVVQQLTKEITWDANTLWNEDGPHTWMNVTFEDPTAYTSEAASPMEPARMRKDLQDSLPSNAIVCVDTGSNTFFNMHYLKITGEQEHYNFMLWGSMGHMMAGAVGAALARPNQPVIAVAGDGAFMMNGMEIITAAEYGANNLVWVIENNEAQGMVFQGSLLAFGEKYRHAEYKWPISPAKIAKACGLDSYLVTAPGQLQDAMRQALASPGPAVIEVKAFNRPCPGLLTRAKQLFKKK